MEFIFFNGRYDPAGRVLSPAHFFGEGTGKYILFCFLVTYVGGRSIVPGLIVTEVATFGNVGSQKIEAGYFAVLRKLRKTG